MFSWYFPTFEQQQCERWSTRSHFAAEFNGWIFQELNRNKPRKWLDSWDKSKGWQMAGWITKHPVMTDAWDIIDRLSTILWHTFCGVSRVPVILYSPEENVGQTILGSFDAGYLFILTAFPRTFQQKHICCWSIINIETPDTPSHTKPIRFLWESNRQLKVWPASIPGNLWWIHWSSTSDTQLTQVEPAIDIKTNSLEYKILWTTEL